jgi:GT2 family glycosyltransferase
VSTGPGEPKLPSASVVVAAYNAEATVGECVGSLLDVRYPRELLQLLVVDNGSEDETVAAVREQGGGVELLFEQKRGAAAARNAGIRAAAGDVVAFTDADCTVDPDWLARLVEPLTDPQVGITGGAIRAAAGANEIELFGERIHDHRRAIEELRPPYAITMNWASRRQVLGELGGFDERFIRGQDVDLSYRAIEAGYRIAFAAGAVIYHRNERTLGGLLREGFVHGFHGVRARKRHEDFLRRYGHGRGGSPRLSEIGGQLRDWARGRDASRARCQAAFNSGKKAGRLLGSLRFGHFDV